MRRGLSAEDAVYSAVRAWQKGVRAAPDRSLTETWETFPTLREYTAPTQAYSLSQIIAGIRADAELSAAVQTAMSIGVGLAYDLIDGWVTEHPYDVTTGEHRKIKDSGPVPV